MKTATIERYHIFGTCQHERHVLYRGRHIGARNQGYFPDDLQGLESAKQWARAHGFTHYATVNNGKEYGKRGTL